MTACDAPVQNVWMCLDCGHFGENSRRCESCASQTVHPVGAWLNREVPTDVQGEGSK